MILCSCNMLTDRDVKASAKPCGRRADRARDVFHSKGCQPKCGRCIKNIHAMCNRECAKVAVSLSPPYGGGDRLSPPNDARALDLALSDQSARSTVQDFAHPDINAGF